MDRADGHLQDTLTESRPVDVALSLEGRQHGLDREVLAQGINIGPIIMQGDPAGIRVSNGLQTKPILDFALLPVHRRQLGGEGGELKTVSTYRRSHDQILSAALLFQDIVVEENAFCRTPVFSKHRNQPGPELASQVFCDRPNVGIAQNNIDFTFTVGAHGLNLLAELLPKSFKHCGHCLHHHPPTTMPTALWISLNNGAGIQKPITIITTAKPTTEDFFQPHISARGRPGSSPRTRLAMCTRKPEKISTRKETKKIASTK